MATSTSAHRTIAAGAAPGRPLLRELEDRGGGPVRVGPNWFASVMGTGIVANAAALLPRHVVGLRGFAVAVWVLAALWLLVLATITAFHWARHAESARRHGSDPAMVPFYGAPPMAMMTVGAGALLVGHDVIGTSAAVVVAFVLWGLGTVTGLACSILVPYRLFTRRDARAGDVSATWLMPVVPPMVSAATGAALIPHLPAGQAREALLLACYALFGVSLLASLVIIALVWGRLAQGRIGAVAAVPTYCIVLGPLGQSITATNLLGAQAHLAVDAPYAGGFEALGVVYGTPVLGFAMLWLALAVGLVVRAARQGLRFSLAWWSFTFPVGTLVTGTSVLAEGTGLDALAWTAVGLYVLLVVAWVAVVLGTVRGVVRAGAPLQAA